MKITIIDGQGGRIGRTVIEQLKKKHEHLELYAIGTNSAATAAMLRAGADRGATGENAVVAGCRRADIIAGPLGLVIADALLGEITPAMALAVGQSRAKRILIPVNHCDNIVVGVADLNLGGLIQEAVERICAEVEHR